MSSNLTNDYLQSAENQYNNYLGYNSNNEEMANTNVKRDKSSDNLFENNNFYYIHNNEDNYNDINNAMIYIPSEKADKLYYSKEEYSIVNKLLQEQKEKNKKYKIQLNNALKQNSKTIEKLNEIIREMEETKNNFREEIKINNKNNELKIQKINAQNDILKQKNFEKEKEINNLKKELENVNKIIGSLKNGNLGKDQKIKELENKDKQNINLINIFKNKIKEKEEEKIKLKNDIEQLKTEKNELNNIINQQDSDLINLENKIGQKDTELKNLKRMVEVKKEELDDLKKYRGEEMIVKIKSTDQEIDYDIPCYSEDPFYIVEEKLYEKFERYREKNNIFLYGGRAILRYKTIKENNINDSMPILLFNLSMQSNMMSYNSFCLFSNYNNNNNEKKTIIII